MRKGYLMSSLGGAIAKRAIMAERRIKIKGEIKQKVEMWLER